jgi:hypothetical protein
MNGTSVGTLKMPGGGYAVIKRRWQAGDKVELKIPLEPRTVVGDHHNQGKLALLYGPLVLAADEALTGGKRLESVRLASGELADLGVTPQPVPEQRRTWAGDRQFRVNATTRRGSERAQIELVPFADAGATGTRYKVWLPLVTPAGKPSGENLLEDGNESRSRQGNVDGSILEGRYVVTYDGRPAAEDWYAVTVDEPMTIRGVIFRHGKAFHDGGWFDASAGKPQVQVQVAKGGPWKTIGQLTNYPATTGADSAGLADGARFSCKLAEPMRIVGVRVVGKPACGDSPQQAFSSCGGLQVSAR